MAFSAIVINYNGGKSLATCVEALLEQSGLREVLVVDNGSMDGSGTDVAAKFPSVTLIKRPNNGFAAGANHGATVASFPFLIFLNPDTILGPGCLASLGEALLASTGIVAPRLWLESERRAEYGAHLDLLGHPRFLGERGRPLYVSGCALATRKEWFDHVGRFDERYFLFVEDVDLCWRTLLAGGDVNVVEDAYATHAGGGSTPGGYVVEGAILTSRMRVGLRERNTLAVLLKCARGSDLLWQVPLYLCKTAVVVLAALVLGPRSLARDVVAGVAWNLRELPRTLRLRRAAFRLGPAQHPPSERMYRGMVMLQLLRRHGRPRFVS